MKISERGVLCGIAKHCITIIMSATPPVTTVMFKSMAYLVTEICNFLAMHECFLMACTDTAIWSDVKLILLSMTRAITSGFHRSNWNIKRFWYDFFLFNKNDKSDLFILNHISIIMIHLLNIHDPLIHETLGSFVFWCTYTLFMLAYLAIKRHCLCV